MLDVWPDVAEGERIFHLDADVVQPSLELIRVVLRLFVEHAQLHSQLLVLYGPHLLQGGATETERVK